jgi:predicted ribonuclease YlaK
VTEFDLWLVRKDFEAKIKKDMIGQVLEDYHEVKLQAGESLTKQRRKRERSHRDWFREKVAEEQTRRETERLAEEEVRAEAERRALLSKEKYKKWKRLQKEKDWVEYCQSKHQEDRETFEAF